MNEPQLSVDGRLPLTNASKHATTPEALRVCHQTKDAAVRHMHGVYERLCGVPVRLRMDHMLAWNEWLCAGHDERDLRMMSYLKEEIDRGRRNIGALKLNNLRSLLRYPRGSRCSHFCPSARRSEEAIVERYGDELERRWRQKEGQPFGRRPFGRGTSLAAQSRCRSIAPFAAASSAIPNVQSRDPLGYFNRLHHIPRFEDDLQMVRMQRRGLRRNMAEGSPPGRPATPVLSHEEQDAAHQCGLALMREWKQRNRHLRRD